MDIRFVQFLYLDKINLFNNNGNDQNLILFVRGNDSNL